MRNAKERRVSRKRRGAIMIEIDQVEINQVEINQVEINLEDMMFRILRPFAGVCFRALWMNT